MSISRSSGFVAIPIGDQPARDPHAACDGCGTTGTVGRATRHVDGAAVEEHRYCARCWPEWSAFYRARWREEDHRASAEWQDRFHEAPDVPPPPPSGMAFVTATWHPIIKLVRMLRDQSRVFSAPPPSAEERARHAEDLARYAAEFQNAAADREGPMPIEVRSFLAEYGRPPSPDSPTG